MKRFVLLFSFRQKTLKIKYSRFALVQWIRKSSCLWKVSNSALGSATRHRECASIIAHIPPAVYGPFSSADIGKINNVRFVRTFQYSRNFDDIYNEARERCGSDFSPRNRRGKFFNFFALGLCVCSLFLLRSIVFPRYCINYPYTNETHKRMHDGSPPAPLYAICVVFFNFVLHKRK